jgi:hypothetical protein
MLRKTCVIILILVVFCIGSAQASLLFTLNPAVMSGMPGDSLTLTNTYNYELYLNGNSFTFAGSSTDFGVSGLLGSVPLSLMPAGDISGGDTYMGSIFDVQILSSAATGKYAGSYSMLGGADDQGQDELVDCNFQVEVTGTNPPQAVPEPATLLGFGVPILMVGLGKLRRLRK